MEISVHSEASTSKIPCDLNEEFHQYHPPATKIPLRDNNKYNVFLSFRGKDVRTTFVDHLYQALCGAGLRVFLDSEELEKGKDFQFGLITAIDTSDIFILIFSRNYAESTWCLKEAAQMCKSNGFIIPLFYDVEPCDVRYPRRNNGLFKQAFVKHDSHLDRQSKNTVDAWEKALHQISFLSGWSRADEFGYEAKLVKKVVKDVLDTLEIIQLDVPEHHVGLQTDMLELLKKLALGSWHSIVKVGISGLGGVSKTTLAKAVYNIIYTGFDVHCFAEKNTTLLDLQRAILRSLANYHGEVSSVAVGKALMRNLLRQVRALVVLDDVNDCSHLNAVNGKLFGPGSRIIITSRDKHILNLAKVDSVLQMSGLLEDEALQLFCWHAFSKPLPESPYKKLSTRIARACRGHPLSLQVIGAHLFDKRERHDIHCWEEALHNIGENHEISRVLRISYDRLSYVEKQIFLDIACCFAGERKNDAITFWKVLYPNRVQTALKNLLLKMLINYSGSQDLLNMHDLLRGMGRIVQEQADNNTRLLLPAFAHRGLSRYRAEGVNMLVCIGENGREPVSLHRMHSLRYLAVLNTKIVGKIGNLWIKIRNCELSDTYTWLTLKNKFQLESNSSQVKILNIALCASLTRIPKTPGSLTNLQFLYLQYCVTLTTLPSILGNLSELTTLYLCGCTSLTSLPDTVGNLKRLKFLSLNYCVTLTTLPSILGNLSELEGLSLCGCTSLTSLPDTVGNLKRLYLLDLQDCTSLRSLPSTLGDLAQLQILDIRNCRGPRNLPRRLDGLGPLRSHKIQIVPVWQSRNSNEVSSMGGLGPT